MNSAGLLQTVLADYGAFLAGGTNALAQTNRLKAFLNAYPENRYASVLFQLLCYTNANVGWVFAPVQDEVVVPIRDLARLTAALYTYRSYGDLSSVDAQGYNRYLNGVASPTLRNIVIDLPWRLPNVVAAPPHGAFTHSVGAYNLVSSAAGNAVINLPVDIACTDVYISRYNGTFAGQANGVVAIGGRPMIGNTLHTRVAGGAVISLTNGAGVYDIVTVTFGPSYIYTQASIVEDFAQPLGSMAIAQANTMASRVLGRVLDTAGVATVAELYVANNLRATCPLWHCRHELLAIASAGRV